MVKMAIFNNDYRRKFSLTNDLVFFLVYGAGTEESNRALMAVLNLVLDRNEDPITEVTVTNPVQKGIKPGDKTTIMDIKAETGSGELIDVEMQKGKLQFFRERALFYGGKMVSSSLASSEYYDKMKKSIVISFVDGTLFPKNPNLHTEFLLQETQQGEILTDRLAIYFLELDKIGTSKTLGEMSSLERFCAYLKYAGDEEKEGYVNKLLEMREEAVDMSEHVFRKITDDDIAREILERQERDLHDWASWEEQFRREGLAKGLEEGRQEGLEEGRQKGLEAGLEEGLEEGQLIAKQEIARKMKMTGMTMEEIISLTGLTVEQVNEV